MDPLASSYNPLLVALSALVSAFGSYTSLRLAKEGSHARPGSRERRFWLFGAAGALGAGAIWSMHFIAMVAFELPVPVRYDLLLTLASLVIAILVPAAAYAWVDSRPRSIAGVLGAGTLMGLGIGGMHFTGMAAMRMPATATYDTGLVILALLIGAVAAIAALDLSLRHPTGVWQWVAAVVMAGAVSGMHYTGMAAASFTPGASGEMSRTLAVAPSVLAYGVFLLAAILLSVQLGLAVGAKSTSDPDAHAP